MLLRESLARRAGNLEMKFKTLTGRLKEVNVKPYLIDYNNDSLSDFQYNIKTFLKPYWQYDVVCEELPVAGTKLRFDFINLNKHIVVEANGIAHLDPKSHFHGGSKTKWLSQIKRDMLKHKWCEINGYTLVEIEPDDIPLSKDFFLKEYNIKL